MRQDFSTTHEDFIGSIFQQCKMASYIRAVREQNAIKIFTLANRKISLCVFALWAKLVKSYPNPVDISTTWKKFNILSFYHRSDAISEKTISRYCPFKGVSLPCSRISKKLSTYTLCLGQFWRDAFNRVQWYTLESNLVHKYVRSIHRRHRFVSATVVSKVSENESEQHW